MTTKTAADIIAAATGGRESWDSEALRECAEHAPSANRRQVRSWMRNNVEDYECATTLAEGANAALDLPAGAMDDETHWVWEEALSAIEWANA